MRRGDRAASDALPAPRIADHCAQSDQPDEYQRPSGGLRHSLDAEGTNSRFLKILAKEPFRHRIAGRTGEQDEFIAFEAEADSERRYERSRRTEIVVSNVSVRREVGIGLIGIGKQ